jgi:transposase
LHCTNVPETRLDAAGVLRKYKEQSCVEQSIDFIKSPMQIRPMWLHLPERIAALTLLVMIAALVATLLEQQVRRWIARTGGRVAGLMPENRDNAYPTARALLRAFGNYALVVTRHEDGHEEMHFPRLGSVQQQIWDILRLAPAACL